MRPASVMVCSVACIGKVVGVVVVVVGGGGAVVVVVERMCECVCVFVCVRVFIVGIDRANCLTNECVCVCVFYMVGIDRANCLANENVSLIGAKEILPRKAQIRRMGEAHHAKIKYLQNRHEKHARPRRNLGSCMQKLGGSGRFHSSPAEARIL